MEEVSVDNLAPLGLLYKVGCREGHFVNIIRKDILHCVEPAKIADLAVEPFVSLESVQDAAPYLALVYRYVLPRTIKERCSVKEMAVPSLLERDGPDFHFSIMWEPQAEGFGENHSLPASETSTFRGNLLIMKINSVDIANCAGDWLYSTVVSMTPGDANLIHRILMDLQKMSFFPGNGDGDKSLCIKISELIHEQGEVWGAKEVKRD
ncbi:hypothetical protein ONZ45_g15796 [Pleurotus djamor]|nr:hypothetical protein ONZ45_g15796 [Pleurotus djamor]